MVVYSLYWGFSAVFLESELSFGGGQIASASRIALAGRVDGSGPGLEEALHNMVRFLPIEKLQMEIAPCFIGESLEEFPGQTEAERRRHILVLLFERHLTHGLVIQTAVDQIGTPAKINDAANETLIHRQISLSGKGIARIKTGAVAAQPSLITESRQERLTQCEAAILHRMMGIDLYISLAMKLQVHHGVLGKKGKHVIKERNPRLHGRFTRPAQIQLKADIGLLSRSFNYS